MPMESVKESTEASCTNNVLPEFLKDHLFAKKYQYINYDEELGRLLPSPGFYVKTSKASFMSPFSFCKTEDAFESTENNTISEGDFILTSPMKCGAHWTWEIMNMLVAGTSQYKKQDKMVTWIDIKTLETIEKESPSPRVLNTHLPMSWISDNFRRKDTKVVAVLRNLKDALVSRYYHLNATDRPVSPEAISWENIFTTSLHSKYTSYGHILDQVAAVWDDHKNDPNILLIFYEDLKLNTREVIERLAKHMAVDYTSELLDEITKAVDIKQMKSVKIETEAVMREKHGLVGTLYRKGEIGDWKNLFTPAQNEEFDKVINEWNKQRQIPFIYELPQS